MSIARGRAPEAWASPCGRASADELVPAGSRGGPGGLASQNPGEPLTRDDNALYGFVDRVAPPFDAVQLHNPVAVDAHRCAPDTLISRPLLSS